LITGTGLVRHFSIIHDFHFLNLKKDENAEFAPDFCDFCTKNVLK